MWVLVGTPLSQYGVVCAVCILGVLVCLSSRATLLTSWSAMSLPIMHVCALTLCIVILCVDQVMWLTIADMSSLSGWLCWDDGCRMWLCIRYMLLRLSVNMCMSCVLCFVLWTAIRIVFSSALRMFCRPESLSSNSEVIGGTIYS